MHARASNGQWDEVFWGKSEIYDEVNYIYVIQLVTFTIYTTQKATVKKEEITKLSHIPLIVT